MRVLAVTSGRADATPMGPVVEAMEINPLRDVLELGGRFDMSSAAGEVEDHVQDNRYDCILLLGDRFEMLAAAAVATYYCIPIAHIHGGEASFGSFDNQIRDAITKLAHIHFVAAPEFKMRLVEGLGEHPNRVHVVGAPGLDNLIDLPPRNPEKYFVCTYHPATLEKGRMIGYKDGGDPLIIDNGLSELVHALDRFPDYDAIWTGVNNDPGSDLVRDALHGRDVRSLDPREYIRLCRNAAAVVGNSSSGIIEAPTLQVPTVNVRPRQDGRLKGPSIIDCFPHEIETGIRLALEYEGPYDNPYGGPGASQKIADILATAEIDMVKSW